MDIKTVLTCKLDRKLTMIYHADKRITIETVDSPGVTYDEVTLRACMEAAMAVLHPSNIKYITMELTP